VGRGEAVIGALKRAWRERGPAEWEFVPEGWARATAPDAPPLRGWDVESVAEAYRTRLPEFERLVAGTEPVAIPTSASVAGTPPNVNDQNTILVFGLALTRAWALRGDDHLSVLDFGGGFGFSSFLARALLPETVAIDYHVEEVATVCDAARAAVPSVTFTTDATTEARRFDLVMASNSLQYACDWQTLVRRLAAATERLLLLSAVPSVMSVPSFVVLQRTQKYRFDTEYLSWIFNREELVDAVTDAGLALEREFLQSARPAIPRAPEPPHTRGFLFERRAGRA
jgi:putative methyltransferase (TIGR04325 family)